MDMSDDDWDLVAPNFPCGPHPAVDNDGVTEQVNNNPIGTCVVVGARRIQSRGVSGSSGSEMICPDQLARYRQDFDRDGCGKVAQNALQYNSVHDIAIRRDLLQTCLDFTFSVEIDGDGMDATSQKSSGRCWLFAALNLLRISTATKLNVHRFEFSEAFPFFYDKLEKANCFLESVMRTADRPLDDRTVSMLMEDPIPDGGEWVGAASLIAKYGLVPKSAFPETYSSSNTASMNGVLADLLTSSAFEIRTMLNKGEAEEDVRAFKDERMDAVWRILAIHLGTPPEQFTWQWRDRDGVFHSCGTLSPKEFALKFVNDVPWKSYVSLIQDPRNEYYRTYTVDYSQTLMGGYEMLFLNVTTEDTKALAEKMLVDGRTVWFACNVGQEFAEAQGLWDANLYDFEDLYKVKNWRMDKADRIRYGYPMGTHAMLFTGVDLEEGDNKPRRWRVENSWGDSDGKDGYYTMNDNWFDMNVFEIVVHPDYLTPEMVEGLKTEPTLLPAWDAMGTACGSSTRSRRRF